MTRTTLSKGKNAIQRVDLKVDWSQTNGSNTSVVMTVGRLPPVFVTLLKVAVPDGFTGFVESSGVVSIEACHTGARTTTTEHEGDGSVVDVPNAGRTLCGVTAMPLNYPAIKDVSKAPVASYDFFLTSNVNSTIVELIFDTMLQTDCENFPQVGLSIDDTAVQMVDVFLRPSVACKHVMADLPPNYSDDVLQASHRAFTTYKFAGKPGAHTVKVSFPIAGVVLTKVILHVGPNTGLDGPAHSLQAGAKGFQPPDATRLRPPIPSYLGPPESGRVGGSSKAQ